MTLLFAALATAGAGMGVVVMQGTAAALAAAVVALGVLCSGLWIMVRVEERRVATADRPGVGAESGLPGRRNAARPHFLQWRTQSDESATEAAEAILPLTDHHAAEAAREASQEATRPGRAA